MRRDAVGGYKAGGNVWRGRNLPNNVATGPDIVVQESQACFGDEIGETHICSCVWLRVWNGRIEGVVLRKRGTTAVFDGGNCAEKNTLALALARAPPCLPAPVPATAVHVPIFYASGPRIAYSREQVLAFYPGPDPYWW